MYLAAAALTASALSCSAGVKQTASLGAETDSVTSSVVYYIKEISPENVMKIYEALGRPAKGKVAVKVHTGEPGNPNILQPELVRPLIEAVNGTIVECNTAYNGKRDDSESHLAVAKEHGWIADNFRFDLLDAEADTVLPIKSSQHLDGKNYVGKNLANYDFLIDLTHFKGHPMGGFGGALKNISIGTASAEGKMWIHSAGHSKDKGWVWGNLPPQDDFIESMAEAASSIADYFGENIIYINIANNLSVDCDCVARPEKPEMDDIGILASLDPVALDRACVDMVYNSTDHGKKHLIERIESRHGAHIIDHAEKLGMGTQTYTLITLE